jgi:hypothetical protein
MRIVSCMTPHQDLTILLFYYCTLLDLATDGNLNVTFSVKLPARRMLISSSAPLVLLALALPPKRSELKGNWLFLAYRGTANSFLSRPNVRANRAPTVGSQARAGENVPRTAYRAPRTASPGLVARRWCSG